MMHGIVNNTALEYLTLRFVRRCDLLVITLERMNTSSLGVTRGYRGLQEITGCYRGLEGVTSC